MNTAVSWDKVSDPQYSFILGGIALLILIIACINYVSLALTTSTARRTEVGVRKVVGAQKKQLVYQFGLESLMLAFISMFLGLGLVFLFLPAFNEFTGKSIRIGLGDAGLLLGASASITLVVGVLAGSYPALFLSGFRPAQVLKGRFTARLQAGFTRPLVVLQFALSAFLIISSVIMYQQMQYVTTKDLGYSKDQLLVIPTQTRWSNDANKMVERFRTRLQQEPSVVSVAGTSISFNQGWSHYGYKVNGEHKSAYVYAVDPYYLHTLGVEMVMGRNFDARIPSDTGAVVVNEALVRDMKWSDPLNEYLNWKEDTVGVGAKVIGVVKDYHFLSLEKDIEPLFLSMDKESVGYLGTMLVKVNATNLPATVEKLRGAWKELSPDKPFDYTFLNEDVARQYESYQRWMGIMGLSTAFAILIACLGLFGLSGINAVNRTKEIGIRKVMGATLAHIFVLLNRQYLTLALVAFVGAIPASWYVMTHWWLVDFKFRIALGWELFAVSMLIGVAVALVTVSYHAVKAAMTNPAETLKYE
jgi:putative ABC transport system permease protein